jgi:hypothetical protein
MGVLSLRSYDCNGIISAGALFEMEPNRAVPYTRIDGAAQRSIIPTDALTVNGELAR